MFDLRRSPFFRSRSRQHKKIHPGRTHQGPKDWRDAVSGGWRKPARILRIAATARQGKKRQSSQEAAGKAQKTESTQASKASKTPKERAGQAQKGAVMSTDRKLRNIAIELWLPLADVKASWRIYASTFERPDVEEFRRWLESSLQPAERFEDVA